MTKEKYIQYMKEQRCPKCGEQQTTSIEPGNNKASWDLVHNKYEYNEDITDICYYSCTCGAYWYEKYKMIDFTIITSEDMKFWTT